MSEQIAANLKLILNEIAANFVLAEPSLKTVLFPRLVAVSKKKPIRDIISAYEAGQRHFGENYVQELCEKANDPEILSKCPEIEWHFIGNLQSNKVSKLISQIPRLKFVESVDSENLASSLNNSICKFWSNQNNYNLDLLLNVFVQVNTSSEDQKSGISPQQCSVLANFIVDSCPRLKFMGFMTIGSLDESLKSKDETENADFSTLARIRREYCGSKNIPLKDVELSMGMSSDYQTAIRLGSTNVRVGSAIFGHRS